MTKEWTGGDPDEMAEMGVIGDPIPNGEDHYGQEEPENAGEEEWV